jgi:hypothetical protein
MMCGNSPRWRASRSRRRGSLIGENRLVPPRACGVETPAPEAPVQGQEDLRVLEDGERFFWGEGIRPLKHEALADETFELVPDGRKATEPSDPVVNETGAIDLSDSREENHKDSDLKEQANSSNYGCSVGLFP